MNLLDFCVPVWVSIGLGLVTAFVTVFFVKMVFELVPPEVKP
jgi:hypothetical protein